jgi:hypothetical protein
VAVDDLERRRHPPVARDRGVGRAHPLPARSSAEGATPAIVTRTSDGNATPELISPLYPYTGTTKSTYAQWMAQIYAIAPITRSNRCRRTIAPKATRVTPSTRGRPSSRIRRPATVAPRMIVAATATAYTNHVLGHRPVNVCAASTAGYLPSQCRSKKRQYGSRRNSRRNPARESPKRQMKALHFLRLAYPILFGRARMPSNMGPVATDCQSLVVPTDPTLGPSPIALEERMLPPDSAGLWLDPIPEGCHAEWEALL